MRIAGGMARGRLLKVGGRETRPTQEKVRAAVFSSLAAMVPGARVLDLYAGSGAMGLEAWSRGAGHVEWVEKDRGTARTLKANVEALGAGGEGNRIWTAEVGHWLERRCGEAGAFDLVMADPPYREGAEGGWLKDTADKLARNGWTKSGSVLVWESEETGEPPVLEGWRLARDKRYGKTRVWIWVRE